MKNANKNGKELAEIAGISKQSFSAYKDSSLPNAPVLAAWSRGLDLNINWLLLGEGPMLRSQAQATANAAQEQELQELRAEVARLKDENYRLLQELVEEQRHSLGLFREVLVLDKERMRPEHSEEEGSPSPARGVHILKQDTNG